MQIFSQVFLRTAITCMSCRRRPHSSHGIGFFQTTSFHTISIISTVSIVVYTEHLLSNPLAERQLAAPELAAIIHEAMSKIEAAIPGCFRFKQVERSDGTFKLHITPFLSDE